MRSVLIGLGLLWGAAAAWADSIVPVTSYLSNTVFTGQWVQADVPQATIPDNVIAVVGWSVWIYHTSPLDLYLQMRWWHDGGTPHQLQASLWTPAPGDAAYL